MDIWKQIYSKRFSHSTIPISQYLLPLLLTWNRTFPTGNKFEQQFHPCSSCLHTLFFNSYLATTRPNLDYYWGDDFTHAILITARFLAKPEGHRKPRNEVGPQSPAESISWIRTNLPIWSRLAISQYSVPLYPILLLFNSIK